MPCLYPICKGNLISRYLRRKHAKLYSGGIEGTVASAESVNYESRCSQTETIVELTKSDDFEGIIDSSNCEDMEALDKDPEVNHK